MKRLLLTILCLLFAYPCQSAENVQLARLNPWVAGSVTASAGEVSYTITNPTGMDSPDSAYACWYTAGRTYCAGGFVADGETIKKIEIYVDTTTATDPALGTVTAYIYDDDGGTPGLPADVVATYGALSTTGLGTAGWHSITGSWAGTLGTLYHLVIKASSLDNTNQPRWYRDTTCTTELIATSTDGSTFASASTSACFNMRFYK